MIWIGAKYSDIAYGRRFFSRSLTFCGPNNIENRSLICEYMPRRNYNLSSFDPQEFYKRQFSEMLDEDSSAQFMFYNPLHTYFYGKDIQQRCPCTNASSLLEFLDTKSEVRFWAAKFIPVVPFEVIEGSSLTFDTNANCEYVIQEEHSSGGYGTMLFSENLNKNVSFTCGKKYVVSSYMERTVPVNVNFIVYDDNILLFPPSIQIIKKHKGKLLYIGSDYCAIKQVSPALRERLRKYSATVGKQLQQMGYRGIAGIDYLLNENDAMLLEINARFQASSFLLDDVLADNGLETIFELNLNAFLNKSSPQADIYEAIIPKSCLAYVSGLEQNISIPSKGCMASSHEINIYADGYVEGVESEESAYLYRCVFSENICDVSADNQAVLHPNLTAHTETWQTLIEKDNPLALKISLLNQGVTLSENANNAAEAIRLRKGAHSAVDLRLGESMVVNCPINSKFTEFSPFQLDFNQDIGWNIKYNGRIIKRVGVDIDVEQELRTKKGVPYSSCSFFATDRVRIHHTNFCIYKHSGMGCAFCDASISCERFDMDDVEEVIDYYSRHPRVRHFLIGGGSSSHDAESNEIVQIVNIIRKYSDKDIYVMCLPPKNNEVLEELHCSGVTQISFNIEFFDRELARKLMPGKGRLPLEQYLDSLTHATQLWGKNGNVRSLLIVGPESRESALKGIRMLCGMGVQPILSPFRPLTGTPMQACIPPTNEWLWDLYHNALAICNEYGQRLGPDCCACQNNTLALP